MKNQKIFFPTEISCRELDGKYNEITVEIQNDWHTDEEYAKAGIARCDGDYLESKLKELYEKNNINWEAEQKEIKEYFDSLDIWEDITVHIPANKKGKLLKFVKSLEQACEQRILKQISKRYLLFQVQKYKQQRN